jgi:hypothetical protein
MISDSRSNEKGIRYNYLNDRLWPSPAGHIVENYIR